ncbi:MAG: hypothetical protein ACTSUE_13855 [Promethearchaeota archaeon]
MSSVGDIAEDVIVSIMVNGVMFAGQKALDWWKSARGVSDECYDKVPGYAEHYAGLAHMLEVETGSEGVAKDGEPLPMQGTTGLSTDNATLGALYQSDITGVKSQTIRAENEVGTTTNNQPELETEHVPNVGDDEGVAQDEIDEQRTPPSQARMQDEARSVRAVEKDAIFLYTAQLAESRWVDAIETDEEKLQEKRKKLEDLSEEEEAAKKGKKGGKVMSNEEIGRKQGDLTKKKTEVKGEIDALVKGLEKKGTVLAQIKVQRGGAQGVYQKSTKKATIIARLLDRIQRVFGSSSSSSPQDINDVYDDIESGSKPVPGQKKKKKKAPKNEPMDKSVISMTNLINPIIDVGKKWLDAAMEFFRGLLNGDTNTADGVWKWIMDNRVRIGAAAIATSIIVYIQQREITGRLWRDTKASGKRLLAPIPGLVDDLHTGVSTAIGYGSRYLSFMKEEVLRQVVTEKKSKKITKKLHDIDKKKIKDLFADLNVKNGKLFDDLWDKDVIGELNTFKTLAKIDALNTFITNKTKKDDMNFAANVLPNLMRQLRLHIGALLKSYNKKYREAAVKEGDNKAQGKIPIDDNGVLKNGMRGLATLIGRIMITMQGAIQKTVNIMKGELDIKLRAVIKTEEKKLKGGRMEKKDGSKEQITEDRERSVKTKFELLNLIPENLALMIRSITDPVKTEIQITETQFPKIWTPNHITIFEKGLSLIEEFHHFFAKGIYLDKIRGNIKDTKSKLSALSKIWFTLFTLGQQLPFNQRQIKTWGIYSIQGLLQLDIQVNMLTWKGKRWFQVLESKLAMGSEELVWKPGSDKRFDNVLDLLIADTRTLQTLESRMSKMHAISRTMSYNKLPSLMTFFNAFLYTVRVNKIETRWLKMFITRYRLVDILPQLKKPLVGQNHVERILTQCGMKFWADSESQFRFIAEIRYFIYNMIDAIDRYQDRSIGLAYLIAVAYSIFVAATRGRKEKEGLNFEKKGKALDKKTEPIVDEIRTYMNKYFQTGLEPFLQKTEENPGKHEKGIQQVLFALVNSYLFDTDVDEDVFEGAEKDPYVKLILYLHLRFI